MSWAKNSHIKQGSKHKLDKSFRSDLRGNLKKIPSNLNQSFRKNLFKQELANLYEISNGSLTLIFILSVYQCD